MKKIIKKKKKSVKLLKKAFENITCKIIQVIFNL